MERQRGIFIVDFNGVCVDTKGKSLIAASVSPSPISTTTLAIDPQHKGLEYLLEDPSSISLWTPAAGVTEALALLHKKADIYLTSSLLENARHHLQTWVEINGFSLLIAEICLRESSDLLPPIFKGEIMDRILRIPKIVCGVFDDDIKVLAQSGQREIPSYFVDLSGEYISSERVFSLTKPVGPLRSLKAAALLATHQMPNL